MLNPELARMKLDAGASATTGLSHAFLSAETKASPCHGIDGQLISPKREARKIAYRPRLASPEDVGHL